MAQQAYQAPHVGITQTFTPAAPAVGVSGLPAAVYGPAFSVYQQAAMGEIDGIDDSNIFPWLGNSLLEKPIYNKTNFDEKIYDRYPVSIFLQGYGESIARLLTSDYSLSSSGVSFTGNPTFIVGSDVNQNGGVQGTTSGFMPYASGTVTTALAATDNILIDTAADFITAKIQIGQIVHVLNHAAVDFSTTVKRVISSTQIQLSSTPGVTDSSAAYTIGSDSHTGTVMEDFFDLSANFLSSNIQVGDLLVITSNQGLHGVPVSIKQIMNGSWLKVCIDPAVNRNVQNVSELDTLYGASGLTSVTQTTLAYSVQRYFYKAVEKGCIVLTAQSATANNQITVSAGYGAGLNGKNVTIYDRTQSTWLSSTVTATGDALALSNAGIVLHNDVCDVYCQVATPAGMTVQTNLTKLIVPFVIFGGTGGAPNISVGDLARVTYADTSTQEVVIIAAAVSTDTVVFTLQGSGLNKVASTVISEVEFFSSKWTYTSNILISYRAAKFTLSGTILSANSVDDISLLVGNPSASDQGINEYNDLAYMAFIAWTAAGGKTTYMGCTDGSSQNEPLEYAKAEEAMKMYDIYAQAWATWSPDVNSAVGAYCDGQSEPYPGHERVGYVAYRWEDLMLITSSTASASTVGTLTDSTAHFVDEGVAIGDIVSITDNSVITPVTVAGILGNTQIVLSSATQIVTSADVYSISKGNKTAQANVISAISQSLYNRRVTHVWTGDFTVTDDVFGTRVLPGFFACAAIAGWNAGIAVSQGMTNSSVPGLVATPRYSSNWFGQDDLDIIAGGATFILTQPAVGAGLNVRQQLTTNNDSPKTGEDSVRRQVDTAAKTTRNTYKIYLGKSNIDQDFINFLSNEVWSTIVTNLKKRKAIRDMQLLQMIQNPNLLTGVIAKVKVTAYYPLNEMDIELII